MMAALPSGANALLFAQRYGALQAQTAAVNLLTTVLFVVTAPLWLLLLEWVA
jgi:predicted permease